MQSLYETSEKYAESRYFFQKSLKFFLEAFSFNPQKISLYWRLNAQTWTHGFLEKINANQYQTNNHSKLESRLLKNMSFLQKAQLYGIKTAQFFIAAISIILLPVAWLARFFMKIASGIGFGIYGITLAFSRMLEKTPSFNQTAETMATPGNRATIKPPSSFELVKKAIDTDFNSFLQENRFELNVLTSQIGQLETITLGAAPTLFPLLVLKCITGIVIGKKYEPSVEELQLGTVRSEDLYFAFAQENYPNQNIALLGRGIDQDQLIYLLEEKAKAVLNQYYLKHDQRNSHKNSM